MTTDELWAYSEQLFAGAKPVTPPALTLEEWAELYEAVRRKGSALRSGRARQRVRVMNKLKPARAVTG